MKKLFTLVLLFCSLQSFGQLTLIKKSDKPLIPFQLANGNWMLYSTSFNQNKLKSITLYNKDYSVNKIIPVSHVFPHDTNGYRNGIYVKNILKSDRSIEFNFTDKFFNDDDKIEFVLMYSSNNEDPKSGYNYVQSTALIINEDGIIIHKITNLSGNIELEFWGYLNVNFEDIYEKTISTEIYSVPGNLPCPTSCSQKSAGIAPITQPNEFKEIEVTGFPNPSSEKVTLAYSLPEGTPFGTLRLYTQTGELVKEFKVSNQVDHLELPVSEYNSGTYFYELQAGGISSGGKKMVVIH